MEINTIAILTKSRFMIYRVDMFSFFLKSAAKVELFKGLVNRKMYRYIEYCIKWTSKSVRVQNYMDLKYCPCSLSLRRGGDALSLQGKLFNLNKEP